MKITTDEQGKSSVVVTLDADALARHAYLKDRWQSTDDYLLIRALQDVTDRLVREKTEDLVRIETMYMTPADAYSVLKAHVDAPKADYKIESLMDRDPFLSTDAELLPGAKLAAARNILRAKIEPNPFITMMWDDTHWVKAYEQWQCLRQSFHPSRPKWQKSRFLPRRITTARERSTAGRTAPSSSLSMTSSARSTSLKKPSGSPHRWKSTPLISGVTIFKMLGSWSNTPNIYETAENSIVTRYASQPPDLSSRRARRPPQGEAGRKIDDDETLRKAFPAQPGG